MARKHEEESVLDTIRDLKRREPFTPFRIVMTSGESYTIQQPDLLAMNEQHLVYCLPKSSRVVYLRLNQIVTVDDVGEEPVRRGRVA